MSTHGRRNVDSILIAELAIGTTKRDAATKARISERTVYRRCDDPAFIRQVEAARSEIVDGTLGKLARISGAAAITLGQLLGSESDTVRLGAARAILQLLLQVRESTTLASEIEELRRVIEANEGDRR